jgi:hypothetical protein
VTRRRRGAHRTPQRIILHRAKGSTCEPGHPEPYPLHAVVLNLDTAINTGVAIYIDGRLRAYTEVDANDPAARKQVVRESMQAAEVRAVPLALVTEAPWGGYVSAAVSLAGSVRLWADTWRALGGDPWHFIELTAGQWRRSIIGRASRTREQSRAWEAINASARVAQDMGSTEPIRPDAAAAICMGMVTSRSSGVRTRLGCDLVRPPMAAGKPKT